jgi:hypothetical protein
MNSEYSMTNDLNIGSVMLCHCQLSSCTAAPFQDDAGIRRTLALDGDAMSIGQHLPESSASIHPSVNSRPESAFMMGRRDREMLKEVNDVLL